MEPHCLRSEESQEESEEGRCVDAETKMPKVRETDDAGSRSL
jgi:hypothetical protein